MIVMIRFMSVTFFESRRQWDGAGSRTIAQDRINEGKIGPGSSEDLWLAPIRAGPRRNCYRTGPDTGRPGNRGTDPLGLKPEHYDLDDLSMFLTPAQLVSMTASSIDRPVTSSTAPAWTQHGIVEPLTKQRDAQFREYPLILVAVRPAPAHVGMAPHRLGQRHQHLAGLALMRKPG